MAFMSSILFSSISIDLITWGKESRDFSKAFCSFFLDSLNEAMFRAVLLFSCARVSFSRFLVVDFTPSSPSSSSSSSLR